MRYPRKKRVDYTLKIGERKGSQELIEFLGYNDENRPIFKVKCNNCNKDHTSTYGNFKDNKNSGLVCRQCQNSLRVYKTLSLSESQLSIIYSNYKSRSKLKGWIFELSKDEFKSIIFENCHYCNALPNNFRMDRAKNKRICEVSANSNGVDRIDSSRGYTKDNCVPCCEDCNKAKRNLSYSQFLELIKDIYENLKLNK